MDHEYDFEFKSYAEICEWLLANPGHNQLDKIIDSAFVGNSNVLTLEDFSDLISTFGYNINESGCYNNDSGEIMPPLLKLAEYQDDYHIDIFCKLGAELNSEYFKDINNLIVMCIFGHGANWIFNKDQVIKCVEILVSNGCNYDNTFEWSEYIMCSVDELLDFYKDSELVTSIIKNEFIFVEESMIKFAGKTL